MLLTIKPACTSLQACERSLLLSCMAFKHASPAACGDVIHLVLGFAAMNVILEPCSQLLDLNRSLPFLQGNLILTDSNYEILTLLRTHRDDAKGYAIMARQPYPIRMVRPRTALSQEALSEALQHPREKASGLKGMIMSASAPYL